MNPPIDLKLVKALRELTSLPLLKCRKALQEAGGDLELAKKNLLKEWRDRLDIRPFLSEGNTEGA